LVLSVRIHAPYIAATSKFVIKVECFIIQNVLVGSVSDKIEFRVLIKDGDSYYYILKVEHHGSETFCFLPDAGFHFTEHQSGEAHIQTEKNEQRPVKGIPIGITTGSAGPPCGSGFRHETPEDLGAASSITDFFIPLDSLDSDYQKYRRNVVGCFIIDRALLPDNTSLVHIGLWYVPSINEASFEFNNKDIPECLLYKVPQCEPQIWAFAKPFA